MDFNTSELIDRLERLLAAPIRYEMRGMVGKVRPISTRPEDIRQLDCSGFFEYIIYHTTIGRHDIPAGSRRQWSWLRDNGYTEVDYATYAPRNDDVVRAGFRAAEHRRDHEGRRVRSRAGHVWMVINGATYESTTAVGNDGVCSLNWEYRLKRDEVDAFFTLGTAPGFGLGRSLRRLFAAGVRYLA
ncbi:hypothetical protein [Tropicimonas sp. IMCC6043]|uniref:hypothetical protein n=1 Tax=Tropicimonas sp. IMCC6043 TaxID=2510645 RepID=UPI00101D7C2A|nr:hypothetical protein [Tropicimonas sp. IMCC6043]RYH08194.1 hypothetical protein EU800_17150 [Tropicimonas sp. IMCC6043]